MEHYLAHTDYPIWEVIQNGNGPVSITTDTQGQIKVLPPRTAEEILARERERKARTTLLMALPEDHLAKFHKMTDAKEMWEAIKSRFGGNDESKKMQKYILKQQFEGFSVSNSEGLHKGYDRFQSLLSQLEIHGAGVSSEDANQKFLRSLPSAWSQVSLIMRTKPRVDSLSFDDLTNNVSTAYDVSNPSGQNSQYEHASSYSLLPNQSSYPQLDHEDLEQLDEFDLEEMDLKWQTGHFARECRTKGNQDSRRRDAWNSGNKDKENGRRSGKQEDSKALVTIDGEGVDWTSHSEEEEDYALMACNSSGSDTEVQSCSNECVASYNKLKKLYDEQRAQLSDASIEIKAYTQALKKVEAQLVAHQQGQLWYEEKIRFMKIDLDDKTDVLTYHKKLLAEAEKEKEDLKAKVEKWHNSSKNLSLLQNSQMSANDKFGLGYGDHRYDGILSYENEVLQSVFMNKESDLENQPLYDRFVTAEGMHVVPPPMTGNYMPSGPDIEIDYSQFTYGPKQSQTSESETQTSDFDTCESDYSEDEHVSQPTEEQETPSFANQQAYLAEYQDFNGGPVAFGRSKVYITAKMCDKKNKVLFTDTECLVLSPEFKLPDEKHITRIPRQNNITFSIREHCSFWRKPCPQEANQNAGTKENIDAGDSPIEAESAQDYFVLPIWSSYTSTVKSSTTDPQSAVQTRSKVTKSSGALCFVSISKQRRNNHKEELLQSRFKKFDSLRFCLMGRRNWQEEGIDYDEVFSPVARIEAIRIFLAFASYMGFIVYQMDVKSAFLYGKIDEEVYVSLTSRFLYATLSTFLLKNGYRRGTIDKTLFIKKDKHDIILTASTPIETQKPLVKDEEASDVDVHLYRSMIGSLMYLTASRPDIMFAVCACSRFQVNPKTSHLSAVKRIFRNPQQRFVNFLAGDIISGQCKKQTIVATSTIEAKYVAAADCCG
ncbi:ribonuclease H-like domain-containing protein [Tanacetum coccineum]